MARRVTEMFLESLSNDPFTPCVGLVSIMMVLLHDCLSLRGFVAKPFAQFESSLVEHLGYTKNLIGSMVSDARYRKGGVGEGDFFLPGLNIPKGELDEMDGVM